MALLGVIEAYESAKDRLNGMTFDEFKDYTKDFEVIPMYADGKVCGALMIHENHIHACILSWAEGKWFSRKAARVLNRVIEQFGEAITSATTEKGRAFVLALGFTKDGEIYRSSKKWELRQS